MTPGPLLEEAHRTAISANFSEVAVALQQSLGQKLAAEVAGVRDPKSIGKYARGRLPRAHTEARLRDLYQVVRVLQGYGRGSVGRAWLLASNPALGGKAPLEMLQRGDTAPVLLAAEEFGERGERQAR